MAKSSQPASQSVVVVPDNVERIDEVLGTKQKFWYDDQTEKTRQCQLFKIGRAGEDWAEKVACDLAALLGLPAAQVDFAVHAGQDGVEIRSIVSKGKF